MDTILDGPVGVAIAERAELQEGGRHFGSPHRREGGGAEGSQDGAAPSWEGSSSFPPSGLLCLWNSLPLGLRPQGPLRAGLASCTQQPFSEQAQCPPTASQPLPGGGHHLDTCGWGGQASPLMYSVTITCCGKESHRLTIHWLRAKAWPPSPHRAPQVQVSF